MAKNHNLNLIIVNVRGLIRDQKDTMGQDIFLYQGNNIFTPSESFIDESSLIVYVNSVALSPLYWDYNAITNQIIITMPSGYPLQTNDTITFRYSFYNKYSDTEITGYIQSALCYFVQYRYKKLFLMDDDNDVVSVDQDNTDFTATNDAGITLAEIQFIALITSISIDPQNVRVKTPDIETTPPMHESKQDQIKFAFLSYQKFTGSVEYLEDDQDNSAFWRFSQR